MYTHLYRYIIHKHIHIELAMQTVIKYSLGESLLINSPMTVSFVLQ